MDVFEAGAEFVVGFFSASKADDVDAGGQFPICGEVIEGRDQLAMGEISRGTKDDNGARFCQ